MDAGRNKLRPYIGQSIIQSPGKRLQEHTDILRRQNRLIQDNRSPDDLETVVDAAQDILPFADKQILIGFHARAIDEKIGMGFDFVSVYFLDANVGD